MINLLDTIFQDLDVEALNKEELNQYYNYLKEITPQISMNKLDEKLKFLRIKIRIQQRIMELEIAKVNAGQRFLRRPWLS